MKTLGWVAAVTTISPICTAWVACFVSVADDCVSVTGVLLLNTIFGKFDSFLDFDDKISRASLTSIIGGAWWLVFLFIVDGFSLCHRGSDKFLLFVR